MEETAGLSCIWYASVPPQLKPAAMMRELSTLRPFAPPTTHSTASFIHSAVVEPPLPPGVPEEMATKPYEAI